MKRIRNVFTSTMLVACLILPASLHSNDDEQIHWIPGAVYYMEGHTNIVITSIGEHRLLKHGSPLCEAVLTIIDKDSFIMDTLETFPSGRQRIGVKYGTITPSGRVTFAYPGVEAAIQENVGVTAHGRGIVDGITIYKGWFDELSLFAYFEVIGHQTSWPRLNPYKKDPNDPTLLYEGPISVYEYFDLMVVGYDIP